ncbi:MAG: hypothetical protein HKN20_07010 [Gemmatimonadetes bacterium]|nr:hypothetical protein [Gemmatimonadota bacterium]
MNSMRKAGQFLTGVLFLVLASGLIMSGCNDDEATFSDIMGTSSPAEAPASSSVALPDWTEMQKAVPLTTAQVEPMRNSYESWQQNESRREGMMDFLQQSQNTLEREQFLTLVTYLGDQSEQAREERRAAMANRYGRERGPRDGARQGNRERGHDGKPGESLSEMAEELGLTTEQREQLQTMFASHREEMDALREQFHSGGMTHEEFRAAHEALRAGNHEAMTSVLTEEQAAAFAASRAEHRAERMQEHLERLDNSESDDRRVAFLTDVLDLDAGQAAELASLFAEQRAARRERLEEAIAAAGTDPGVRDRHEDREAMREAMHDAIESLLNADQLEVYDALQTLHGVAGGRGPSGHSGWHEGGPFGRK